MITDKDCQQWNWRTLERCMYVDSTGNMQSLAHADCEAACIFSESCIRYEVSNTYCYLYSFALPPNTCPNGWKHIGKKNDDYYMAQTAYDNEKNGLVPGTNGRCYGKKEGINLSVLVF